MPDDKLKTGKQDDIRINVNQEHELRDWSKKLGVTADELRDAVKKAGPLVADVRKQLKK
ncbi:MAG TPA: DUF3606 domain-containing protein [Methylomirabilota bacterium]|nr:DUF3606 domain-containing protein [Methylomirabilota bacterium]